eukprot:2641675-Pyramimonas_sp.AAC.1
MGDVAATAAPPPPMRRRRRRRGWRFGARARRRRATSRPRATPHNASAAAHCGPSASPLRPLAGCGTARATAWRPLDPRRASQVWSPLRRGHRREGRPRTRGGLPS